MAVRRPRKAIVVTSGARQAADGHGRAVAQSLRELGVDVSYVGCLDDASLIAGAAMTEEADAVEVCLGGAAGVLLLRELLRQLRSRGRGDVSIVVHRVR